MINTGIILILAYPETIVMVSDEWFSPYLRFVGIGNKSHLRAGHAALILIDKETGVLEYHDFGRYITSEPYGRVRGRVTDCELDFPLKAIVKDGEITNLNAILKFLSMQPKLTHGDGILIASVCDEIDYKKARAYITMMQEKHFIRYAAFKKEASNCARFVTDTLIASVTNKTIKKKLIQSNWFTPSTVGNVLLANTNDAVFEVSNSGDISKFTGSQSLENLRCFLDKLKNHRTDFVGTLKPKLVDGLHEKAQWLSGIAAGAWFELHTIGNDLEYDFKRISPHGHIDVYDRFVVDDVSFNYDLEYKFVHYSNCAFFHIQQNGKLYRFDRKPIVAI
ncbi:hypothetical protein APS56_14370 [Pseudalgibacter alginicilyticus]|uniref:Uncharacterized protein n=1 Tax=Pseudalgibacter alginicilyticus TaxID=1736674 RepID=A0A0P0CZZ7_9FLAO|nr:DUF6695 family protein [Pseudalgibacter alginicilyticus]ALJ06248.1 hypothetical protein APS56_14370 [Pseudalgibacter alginicilyticus]